MEETNRIKLLLVENKRTYRWLSEQMGVTSSTVSKWCTYSSLLSHIYKAEVMDLL
jgi:hypothetical protein